MDNKYLQYLTDSFTGKDNLKKVRDEASKIEKTYELEEYLSMAKELYASENFQVQEIGVFLFGYASSEFPPALNFLRDEVSSHPSWKVQEVLAMAFDLYCSISGYEKSLPIIKEWLKDSRANVRRAVSEGLRIWTNRDYFKENPLVAIELLSALKTDESDYVRKSIGNALRDISKKYPILIDKELSSWNLSDKKTMQVYKLAYRFIQEKNLMNGEQK